MTITGNVFHDPLSTDFLTSPLVLVSKQYPLYWWSWMDGGIKLVNASGFVAGDIGAIKQGQIKDADIMCQLAHKGMFTTKWTLHEGTEKEHVYAAKDKVIKGKQLELTMELVVANEKLADSVGAAAAAHRVVSATVNGVRNKMSVHVDKQVAARATREGQLEIAPGVDVVGAVAAMALVHMKSREEGRMFFEWEGTALRLVG